ncbi:hypothetical protein NP233_g11920 [Leucocoprinus birnbaumii]|uniref:Uncharacterized protein n=1 Tax=Leucocoprinus birnbaumii TaxID=56174 RepID=A0AAD5YQH6_9AGAR|nr:hypothetical protein NP233_g11920 [Leucocoprinus birnbaumii]
MPMSAKSKAKKASTAHARRSRHAIIEAQPPLSHRREPDSATLRDAVKPIEITSWKGGVNNEMSDEEWVDSGSDEEPESDEELDWEVVDVTDPANEVLRASQKQDRFLAQMEAELAKGQGNLNAFSTLMRPKTSKDWKKAEANRALGYNKHSARTARNNRLIQERKEAVDCKKREECV